MMAQRNLRFLCRLRVVSAIGLLLWFAAPLAARSTPSAPQYVEGEVLVTFKEAASLGAAQQAAGAHGLQIVRHYRWLSENRHRVYFHLRSKTATTATLIAELKKDPSVAEAEPNYLRWFCDAPPPNDALFPLLWALQNTGQDVDGSTGTANDDIGFLAAWGLARPATNEVVVAVVDTGVDYTHPDLVSNMWTNPGEIAGNGLDDDANGYVDDVHGYDFANSDGDPMDSGFHGTHVAGTIAASGNNGLGIIGVAYKAHIMALKASSDGTTLSSAAIIAAVQYAAMMKQRGVNVVAINASYGGGGGTSAEQSAIQVAGNAGIVFCAAAGNNSANNDNVSFFPASYRLPNMIVVAASDQNDNLASFSDYGPGSVDLAAPGVNILSALPLSQVATTSYVQSGSTTYSANELTFAGLTTGVTGAIYDCGLGYPTNFPPAVKGNIALIQRGTLFFSDKVGNAVAAGARAAIIYNNASGNFNGTLQYASNWIAAVSLSQADGQALLASLPATGTVVNSVDPTQIFQYLDGTSMATPHVSGAVAFAAMNFPSETVAQRVQRILSNVTPVPALHGEVVTGGRLNLAHIVDTDANGLPDWWEQMFFGQLTGTDPSADPDHDGANNLQEFMADTNPTNANSRLRITSVARNTNGISLKWSGGTQARQFVQRNQNLTGTNWINLYTNQPPTSTNASFLDISSTNRTGFYRIQVERP